MAESEPVRLVIAQVNFWVGDVAGNAEKIVRAAREARDLHRADVVAFPELSLTAYPPEDLLLRPGMARRVSEALARLREAVEGIHMIVGYPEYADDGNYNGACVIRDGEIVARYRKHRLPNYGVFDEKRYFRPGSGPAVFEVRGLPIGVTICEDIWEAGPASEARDAGARVLVNINASPFHLEKWRDRSEVLAARGRETGLPIVYVNAVGGQDELVFDGESLLSDSGGDVMYRAPAFEEGLFSLSFDPDGRPLDLPQAPREPLKAEPAIYRAMVLGVRDYINRNGFPGAVIGLSGGIDSAATLAIAVDALGPDRVTAVMMPSRYTSELSLECGREIAERFGVEYHTVSIEAPFNAMLESLEPIFRGLPEDTTEENIQARCRGVILMAISNKLGKVVLATGNKSELAVGYATLYGDMVGGFAPLKDISKTMVYRLVEYRNGLGEPRVPRSIIDRPPSAELRADQKDTDSLPDYPVLDVILEAYVEQDRPVSDIVAMGYDEETVRRVASMVKKAEYKRRQGPIGVKITRRAFGRDRRYPITSGY